MLRIALLTAVIMPLVGNAQTPVATDQPPAVAHALSGWAIDVHKEWAVVSSPQRDLGSLKSVGEVSFFRFVNGSWVLRQSVLPDGLPALSNFGISASIFGSQAVVGSVGNHENGLFSGALYLFALGQDGTWIQGQKLEGSDIRLGDRFGFSHAQHENLIVSGAYMGNGAQRKSGAVYVFESVNGQWQETAKLFPESSESNDFFGYTVAIMDAQTIAVGAYRADGAQSGAGAVYVFSRGESGWGESAKIVPADGQTHDNFGFALAGHTLTELGNEQVLVVGAPGVKSEGVQTGAAYVYRKEGTTWSVQERLIPESLETNAHFGSTLDINDAGGIFVGASRLHSADRRETGSVFAYSLVRAENLSAQEEHMLTAHEEEEFRHFGAVVAADNRHIMVGSPYHDRENLTNSGSVAIYALGTALNSEPSEVVYTFDLEQNYPNPFNPTTTIDYQLAEPRSVRLIVFDVNGRIVAILVNDQVQPAGRYSVHFDASDLASGVYMYRLVAGSTMITRKLTLLK